MTCLKITLGAGRHSPQGKRVEVEDLAETLEQHTGVDAWWSGHVWSRDYRMADEWVRSSLVAVDLDFGVYRFNEEKERVDSIKLGVPEDQRDKINSAWDFDAFCPGATYAHATPHGHRVIWQVADEILVRNEWVEAAVGACEVCHQALAALGLPMATRDNLDAPGWHVDAPASKDPGRLYFGPSATVDGYERTAKVVTRPGKTITSRELQSRVPKVAAPKASNHALSPKATERISDASTRWCTDHPIEIPDKGKRVSCHVCGSDRCMGAVPNLPGRVACHSESHKQLDPACGSISGNGACYVFDALDVEVYQRSKEEGRALRRSDILRADGYLGPRRIHDDAPPIDEHDIEDEDHAETRPQREFTDVGNAERIVDRYGGEMRYTHAHGWLIWDGSRWKPDETGQAERRAIQAIKDIWSEAPGMSEEGQKACSKHAIRSQQRQRVDAALALARVQLGIADHASRYDESPWLLSTPGGTVDLKDGSLNPSRMGDRLTKQTATTPENAKTPRWLAFLEQVQPDAEVRAFLQRWAGYSLTGITSEQCFAFMYGGGANGKSTFLETLCVVFGDYATTTPFDTFLVRSRGGATNDLARLAGARLVRASEPDAGARLSESVVKQATGGELITARFLHREFFEFKPQFKITLSGNHKPTIVGTDYGIWRRVKLVPWTVRIPESEQDHELGEALMGEAAGILQWAIQGAIEWQRIGLNPPKAVIDATQEYRDGEDTIGQFLTDRCSINQAARCANSDLMRVYRAWCEECGERPRSQKSLAKMLVDRQFERSRVGTGRGWTGFSILPEHMSTEQQAANWQD